MKEIFIKGILYNIQLKFDGYRIVIIFIVFDIIINWFHILIQGNSLENLNQFISKFTKTLTVYEAVMQNKSKNLCEFILIMQILKKI